MAVASWPARNGACSPVLNGVGTRLYVCNRHEGTVSLVDTFCGKELACVHVSREPVQIALSTDGTLLAVAILLPDGVANEPVVRSEICLLDAQDLTILHNIPLPNGSTCVRSVAFHPPGTSALWRTILPAFKFLRHKLRMAG